MSAASQAWWHTPLIPALRRQRQADFWVQGQSGLQSEFQDSQGYIEKPCLKNQKQKQNKKQTNKQKFLNILALSLISVGLLQVCLHLIWYWVLVCSELLLLCLSIGLEFLISPILLTWRVIIFCEIRFLHLRRWSCDFFLWVCLYNGLHWWIFIY